MYHTKKMFDCGTYNAMRNPLTSKLLDVALSSPSEGLLKKPFSALTVFLYKSSTCGIDLLSINVLRGKPISLQFNKYINANFTTSTLSPLN